MGVTSGVMFDGTCGVASDCKDGVSGTGSRLRSWLRESAANSSGTHTVSRVATRVAATQTSGCSGV